MSRDLMPQYLAGRLVDPFSMAFNAPFDFGTGVFWRPTTTAPPGNLMAKKHRQGIGIVGLGFMGLTHLQASQKLRGGKLEAIVTSDPRKARGDFRGVQGNFGSGGSRISMDGVAAYPTLDELLSDPAVNLVDICLPTHLHADATIRCLRAGKAVLVEKPIAARPAEARRMIAASERSSSPLLVAQVLKFSPTYAALLRCIEEETYGELRALHLRRVIAKPDWSTDGWLGDPKRSGGLQVDLHIHDSDFVRQVFGMPRAVQSQGVVSGPHIDVLRTHYDFGRRRPLITAEAGWINDPGLPFEESYEANFENATLHFNSTHCPEPCVFSRGKRRNLRLPGGDPFTLELEAAVNSLRTGEVHPYLDPRGALASLELCLAEARSIRSRKVVKL